MYVDLNSNKKHSLFSFDTKVIDDAIKSIHDNGKYETKLLGEKSGEKLILENYKVLHKALQNGISSYKETSNIKTEIDPNVTRALEINAFNFAGWKAAKTMSEAGITLIGDDGNIKPFNVFKKEAGDVFKKQGLNLIAEYQHASQASEMAAYWSDIEKDGDRYNLQYRTMGDNKVRKAHQELNEVTLPPSDAFWNSYYPPNGWGCRCNVVQVRKSKYKTSDSKHAIAIGDKMTENTRDKIWRNNLGKEKRLFPKKHPNFPKGCGDCEKITNLGYNSKNPKCQTCSIIESCKDKYLQKHSSKEWMKDAINSIADRKVCGRSIEVLNSLPKEMIAYCKKNNIQIGEGGIRISDRAIQHALRDNKKERGASVSTQDFINLDTELSNSDIYFDKTHDNFAFVNRKNGYMNKYIIQTNYKSKESGKKNNGNYFITAGVIKSHNVKEKHYIKIK